MKTKDIVQLTVAVVIFAIAGWLIYGQLAPKKTGGAKGETIVKVTPIPADFDQDTLATLGDATKTRDFYTAPDLKSGLGNNQPFGPLR